MMTRNRLGTPPYMQGDVGASGPKGPDGPPGPQVS